MAQHWKFFADDTWAYNPKRRTAPYTPWEKIERDMDTTELEQGERVMLAQESEDIGWSELDSLSYEQYHKSVCTDNTCDCKKEE